MKTSQQRPLEEFRSIYNKLDLNFSKDIEEKIKAFSSPVHSNKFKRNSNSNIWRSEGEAYG